jgi:hypothetical protein
MVDMASRRYGRTPSQMMGLVDKNGQPDQYYGVLLDIALAYKFSLEDRDEKNMDLFHVTQYIISVGKGMGVKYSSKSSKPPKRMIQAIKEEYVKNNSDYIPTFDEVRNRLNIK